MSQPTRHIWGNYIDPDDATLYDRNGDRIPDQPRRRPDFGHVAKLSDELAELAAGNRQKLTFLEFAQAHYEDPNDEWRTTTAGTAMKHLWGTAGECLVAWEDLREAVEQFNAWDLVADSKGRHAELSIPSREDVCEQVEWALDRIMRLAKPRGGWSVSA